MELICNKNAAIVILRTKILYAEHSAIWQNTLTRIL